MERVARPIGDDVALVALVEIRLETEIAELVAHWLRQRHEADRKWQLAIRRGRRRRVHESLLDEGAGPLDRLIRRRAVDRRVERDVVRPHRIVLGAPEARGRRRDRRGSDQHAGAVVFLLTVRDLDLADRTIGINVALLDRHHWGRLGSAAAFGISSGRGRRHALERRGQGVRRRRGAGLAISSLAKSRQRRERR